MKYGFISLAVFSFLFLQSCKNEKTPLEKNGNNMPKEISTTPDGETPPPGPTTTVEWLETVYDFGEISEGEKVTHMYKFKNTGEHPLIISNAKGSCGCTVPEPPKDPIKPGETAEMKVVFDSNGKAGMPIDKRITITANTNPPQSFLTIKGRVKDKPKDGNKKT